MTCRSLALLAGLGLFAGLSLSALPSLGQTRADVDSPDLPRAEILRLSEEARRIGSDRKEGALSTTTGATAAIPPGSGVNASMHGYDALHYALEIEPSRTARSVTGRVTTTLEVLSPGLTEVDFHAAQMTVLSATVNGVVRSSLSFAPGKVMVPICEGVDCPPHDPGDTLVVSVEYQTSPTTGYYYYPRNSYTLSEPFDARSWWPCYDDPSDKATLDLYATVPDSNSCVSNGLLQSVTPAGGGKSVWHWRETHPIATYLVSIAVANFWQWTQDAGGIPVLNVAWPEDSTKAKGDYANVPAMFDVFETRWAPYPFDKYGQATVSPFGPGGMEHQTMTTLRRNLLRGDKLYEFVWAHELAHQWWGDWVTCESFENIWLNEGFATYGEAQFDEDFYGPAKYDSAIAAQMSSALTADNNMRYALYDPPSNFLFGSTIYMKGSVVLHMLRRILDDGAFFAGLSLYGQRHGYDDATTAEFQDAMEDASGEDLDWFFTPWVFDQGMPTYQWSWSSHATQPEASQLVLLVRQVQTNSPYYRMPIELRVARADGLPDTTVTVWNEAQASQSFVLPLEGTPTAVTFDPRNSILKRIQPLSVDVPDPPGAFAGPSVPRLALAIAPNPARGAVQLTGTWHLSADPMREPVRLRLYDASGRRIRDLGTLSGSGASLDGSAALVWDLRDGNGARVAPGLYFAELASGSVREARPVVVAD
ncbi:MAG: M1 family aminopeptidase [Candidatus Eiseniibacteriota bacterium]